MGSQDPLSFMPYSVRKLDAINEELIAILNQGTPDELTQGTLTGCPYWFIIVSYASNPNVSIRRSRWCGPRQVSWSEL